jgi:hypothetical protein
MRIDKRDYREVELSGHQHRAPGFAEALRSDPSAMTRLVIAVLGSLLADDHYRIAAEVCKTTDNVRGVTVNAIPVQFDEGRRHTAYVIYASGTLLMMSEL